LQTGRIAETQVIPQSLRSGLIIALGTLAPKTNLRQMVGRILNQLVKYSPK